MATIKSFKELEIWKSSFSLTVEVYNLFEKNKDYGFKDQIQRATVSIMNNIAEGYERQTNKEFIRFLFISKGSAGEVSSMLTIANERKYISKEKFEELDKRINLLAVKIGKLIHYLRSIDQTLPATRNS